MGGSKWSALIEGRAQAEDQDAVEYPLAAAELMRCQ
jgi:hypothetical protein